MKNNISADIIVVDLDDTLFIVSFWTHLLIKISKSLFRLGLKCEKLNRGLVDNIRNKKVIILSGRNSRWEKEISEKQLKRHNIRYEDLILCPRTEVIMDWKMKELKKIKKKYSNYFWIDDKNEQFC